MNIVSLIMQYLGPIIVNKLASSLGINQTIAQKIVTAALPAILGGLLGRVGKPGGAQALADVVARQDTGTLKNLGSLVGGGQQAKIAEQGFGTLDSLLGNSGIGALASAVGKFGGVDETVSKGLLGMLAPAVLGTLGQQQKAAGLDAAGLSQMLMSQKDNIQAALPADFAKLLGGTGLLDGLGTPPAKVAAPAVPAAEPRSTPSVTPAETGGVWRWAALLAAVALAAWYLLGTPTGPVKVELPTPPAVIAGTTDIGGALGGAMSNLQSSLVGIQDVASAQAALPKLKNTQTEIERLSGLAATLTPENRKTLAAYVVKALPLLMPLIDNLLANSSIRPIVKPFLDQMVGRLQDMAKA